MAMSKMADARREAGRLAGSALSSPLHGDKNMKPPARRPRQRSKRRRPDDTADSSLLSGDHGRQRRKQRLIRKDDLKRARRYGMREAARFNRLKMTWGGVVFIYDPATNQEVTSFEDSAGAGVFSGSRFTEPIVIDKNLEAETPQALESHLEQQQYYLDHLGEWDSHSVFVVDMSGSMRRDDVNGARSRSDAVWMAMARDFVGEQLRQGLAGAGDLVSVVIMKGQASVLMRCEPTDYVLFNRFLELREWNSLRPSGPGNYLPALAQAEELLQVNPKCPTLSLVFFSDGRPSDGVDRGVFRKRIGSIASKLGRRLVVRFIGMSDEAEDFQALSDMASEAAAFGSMALFQRPTMDTGSLAKSFSSLVTSLTQSKTAMSIVDWRSKAIRTDIVRERQGEAEKFDWNQWKIFRNSDSQNYVVRMWMWDRKRDAISYLMDPRCIFCYLMTTLRETCHSCQACFICVACKGKAPEHEGSAYCREFEANLCHGKMVPRPVPSFSVAVKKSAFGEGVERIVRKFHFLGDDGTVKSLRWVAKESRFVEEHSSWHARLDYHTVFCRTQVLASDLAAQFNAQLASMASHLPVSCHVLLRKIPRIRFLEPLVVELMENGQEWSVLVEEMLEGEYRKWNNNMGYVKGSRGTGSFRPAVLDTVNEEGKPSVNPPDSHSSILRLIRAEDIPQAFSHFTYKQSDSKLMVVDLQGVLKGNPDGTREFVLTDPAVHRRDSSDDLNIGDFGRTDRGVKGIQAFFDSHVCGPACHLFNLSSGS